MRGLVVKGVAGFYYVRRTDGAAPAREPWRCRARGIFKKDGMTPTVGDLVEFEALDEEDGVVNAILPRKNLFVRPPIANLDCFFVVAAAAQPKPNLGVLDKFLVTAEMAGTPAVICVNKADLDKDGTISALRDVYGGVYPLLELSCATGEGLEALPRLMEGRKVALAGPSGVGKSTILNMLQEGLNLETGAVSARTERGRHTTRHVELFQVGPDAMVFDTPGFTSFDVPLGSGISPDRCFPELRPLLGRCRFDDCRHWKEPGCAVREALAEGGVSASRYESYLRLLREDAI
ncbi:MAG: ribosome small subunit-dependent GTPase A [Clostridiales Family XIII bacterium]|jgi:ribosome biogenesis GTPase|nr:ribosome small subunit-dependent GTPase A [Clostridiales Family XIII bacterium]